MSVRVVTAVAADQQQVESALVLADVRWNGLLPFELHRIRGRRAVQIAHDECTDAHAADEHDRECDAEDLQQLTDRARGPQLTVTCHGSAATDLRAHSMPFKICGGRGIRTHETFLPTGFQDQLHRPLGQPSIAGSIRRSVVESNRFHSPVPTWTAPGCTSRESSA